MRSKEKYHQSYRNKIHSSSMVIKMYREYLCRLLSIILFCQMLLCRTIDSDDVIIFYYCLFLFHILLLSLPLTPQNYITFLHPPTSSSISICSSPAPTPTPTTFTTSSSLHFLHNLFLSPLPSQPLPLSTTFTTSSSLHYLHNLFLSPLPSLFILLLTCW